jgi:hypothetical protein
MSSVSLTLIPILAHALAVGAGDRSEVRVREDGLTQRIDAVTAGQFSLAVTTSRTNWNLSYLPTLTLLSIGTKDEGLIVLHTGSLQVGVGLSPRTSFSFGESFTYGEQNFRLLNLGAVPGGTTVTPSSTTNSEQTPPNSSATQPSWTSQTIRYVSLASVATVSHQLDRQWISLARVGYSSSQGLDSGARKQLPRFQSANGGVMLAYTASERDRLAFRLDLSRTVTSSTYITSLVLLATDFTRLISRETTIGVSVGAAYAHASIPSIQTNTPSRLPSADSPYSRGGNEGSRTSYSAYPVLAAYTNSVYPIGRTSVTFGLREEMAPIVDRMTGRAVTRLVSTLNTSVAHRQVSFGLVGSGTNSLVDSHQPQTLRYMLNFNEFVQYRILRSWLFELGARQSVFSFANSPETPMMWSVYLAASYTTGMVPL